MTIPGLGSAIGLPGSLAMILPDILRYNPEAMVEFLLWVWLCAALGLTVNACVQLLLSPGEPLQLLRRELDTRFTAAEAALRSLSGGRIAEPARTPLRLLAIAGMTRPLALLNSASMMHPWARERHETIAALITLTDRLVTSAIALEAVAPNFEGKIRHERLMRAAEGCALMRRVFGELRLPATGEWETLSEEQDSATVPPLEDIEGILDQIALALPRGPEAAGESEISSDEKFHLFVPDAFENPEYVRFAIKGTLAALICYICFIGFDYRGIYTCVITCFVLSVSTVGAVRQKGLFRFGGAAVGGGMGLIAVMYLLPNVETIGGFWLVFSAGTAVAAWANFGTPRISYGGYQTGLAFYKAVLQSFGPAFSAKVIRDRLVGVFFGLAVFGIIEHLLWPVRARDVLRSRLAEIMHFLADIARSTGASSTAHTGNTVDLRRRVSLKVESIQRLIESSKFEMGAIEAYKFERGDFNVETAQKFTADAQLVLVLLLSLARQKQNVPDADPIQAAEAELDSAIAKALLAIEMHVTIGYLPEESYLQDMVHAFEVYLAAGAHVPGRVAAGRVAVYRALVTGVKGLFSESLNFRKEEHEIAEIGRRGEVQV